MHETGNPVSAAPVARPSEVREAATTRATRPDPLAPIGLAVVLATLAFLADYRGPAPHYVGRIPIPWSVISAVLIVLVLAQPRSRRALVRTGGDRGPLRPYARMTLGRLSDWWCYYLLMTALLALAVWNYHHLLGTWTEPFALLANGISEEATFRYALPLLAAGAIVVIGAPRVAVPCGVALSCILFATMPGHVDQMQRPLDVAPFLAFAVLTSMVAVRSQSLLPGMLAHTLANLCTLPVTLGVAAPSLRLAGVAAGLLGLVLAAENAIRRDEVRTRAAREAAAAEADRASVLDLDFEAGAAQVFGAVARPSTWPSR
jgi:membrane protease YdiL (CAAX protease family)